MKTALIIVLAAILLVPMSGMADPNRDPSERVSGADHPLPQGGNPNANPFDLESGPQVYPETIGCGPGVRIEAPPVDKRFLEIVSSGGMAGMAEVSAQSTVIFSDDMESGLNGWTTAVYTGTDSLWHQTTSASNSPSISWWCAREAQGNYDTGDTVDVALISPSIALPDTSILYFWEYYDTEPDHDFCMVDVSTDGGTNWVPIRGLSAPYWTAPNGWSGNWVQEALDLTPFGGETVNIRFHFDTGDALFNDYPGWYVDDVTVVEEPFPCPYGEPKMHYPQLPDPAGWDVAFEEFGEEGFPIVLADDWQCTETGPVTDIHLWFSVKGDSVDPRDAVQRMILLIFNDHPDPDGEGPLYSMPDQTLWGIALSSWEFTITPYENDQQQGWYNPFSEVLPEDHTGIWQIDACIPEELAFFQEEGTIYWLGAYLSCSGCCGPADPIEIGWKTSLRHWNDDAVYSPGAPGAWQELRDPLTCQSMDLAFVITGPDSLGTEECPDTLTVTIPDTLVFYGDTVRVPVRVSNVNCPGIEGIVSVELDIVHGDTVAHQIPDTLIYTGTLTEGWANEYNVLPGIPDTTNTILIGIATDMDTLDGVGPLVYLNFLAEDIRHPDSTFLKLERVLFNDGVPYAITQSGWIKLRGYDACVYVDADTVCPSQPITMEVIELDENRDPGAIDSVWAWAYNAAKGDSETVWLYETTPSNGIFDGTVDTQWDPSNGTSGDGAVAVLPGDTVWVSYLDSLTARGTTFTRYAWTEVVPCGVDGSFEVSYVVATHRDRAGIRDTVSIRLTEPDLDINPGLVDTAKVKIINGSEPETEAVDLVETGVHTGVFEARVPTTMGTPGTNDDGLLMLQTFADDLDTLVTTYVDATPSVGGADTVEAYTYVVNMFGDVTFNERVGAFDAHFVLAYAVGLDTASFRDSLVADVTGENWILAYDASLILRYVVRLDSTFAIRRDTTIVLPNDPKNHPFLKTLDGDMIAFGNAMEQSDGTYLVPITLEERDGIISGTLWIEHNPGMEIVDVTTADGYGEYILAHNPETEMLRIAFAGAQSKAEGTGEVLWIRVRGAEDAPIRFTLDKAALNGMYLPVAAETFEVEITEAPKTYALQPNVPNPFNPQTMIQYAVPSAGRVKLVVYNLMGQTVRTLVNGERPVGSFSVLWDGRDATGRDVASGVYLYQMEAAGFSAVRKMVLVR